MAEAFLDFIVFKEGFKQDIVNMNSNLQRSKPEQFSGMSGSKTYSGVVTEFELDSMKLSSEMCRENNSIVSNILNKSRIYV